MQEVPAIEEDEARGDIVLLIIASFGIFSKLKAWSSSDNFFDLDGSHHFFGIRRNKISLYTY